MTRVFHADSVADAYRLVCEMKQSGRFDLFRGQLESWPLQASLTRLTGDRRRKAQERLLHISQWINVTSELCDLLATPERVRAIAQHYGIPTTYVDFTTSPAVAAFFATHGKARRDGAQSSCIYMINSTKLEEAARAFCAGKEYPEPTIVRVEVDNLWRLQAQHGVFLDLPWGGSVITSGLLDAVLPFGVVYFPQRPRFSAMKKSAIYPKRKSRLENLLDEYFFNENLLSMVSVIEANIGPVMPVHADFPLVAAETVMESFGRHPSWKALESWDLRGRETWESVHTTAKLSVSWPQAESIEEFQRELRSRFGAALANGQLDRSKATRFEVRQPGSRGELIWDTRPEDVGAQATPVGRLLERIWDGMRTLPYSDQQVAQALLVFATLVELEMREYKARAESNERRSAPDVLWGRTIFIELGRRVGACASAVVSSDLVMGAMRDDLMSQFRPEVREKHVDDAYEILVSIGDPTHLFEFERFVSLLASTIIPSQLFHCPEGQVHFFSPARIEALGIR